MNTEQHIKDCQEKRDSAMAILDQLIEDQEQYLQELKSFKQMIPDPISIQAERFMWKMLSSFKYKNDLN